MGQAGRERRVCSRHPSWIKVAEQGRQEQELHEAEGKSEDRIQIWLWKKTRHKRHLGALDFSLQASEKCLFPPMPGMTFASMCCDERTSCRRHSVSLKRPSCCAMAA